MEDGGEMKQIIQNPKTDPQTCPPLEDYAD